MNQPDSEVERILFGANVIDKKYNYRQENFYIGEFNEIHWLNTPGPIYTTCTDNCGTGIVEALGNVAETEDGREFIFKQPFTMKQLKETISAAYVDPFGSYYFDGNKNWTVENIIPWCYKNEERINFIVDQYDKAIQNNSEENMSAENYRLCLDFYRYNMKAYLEWYINKVSGRNITLNEFHYDWAKIEGWDKLFNY